MTNWTFSATEYHSSTKDGDCMGNPTPAYYRVWGRNNSGAVVHGCGPSPETALLACQLNANLKDNKLALIAKAYCEAMGIPETAHLVYIEQARQHIAWHKALKLYGEFYQ